jgi:hypothetical protein
MMVVVEYCIQNGVELWRKQSLFTP